MFQVEDARPYAEQIDGRDLIIPIEKYGIKLLSIGFFVDPDQATLWRGGMASNALKQLIGDAVLGDVGLFYSDTPPVLVIFILLWCRLWLLQELLLSAPPNR